MNECQHPHHEGVKRCAHLGTASIEEWGNKLEGLAIGHLWLSPEARVQYENCVFDTWEEAEAWLLSLPVEVPA